MIRSAEIRDQIGQAIRPSWMEIRTKPTKAWSERWIKKFDQEIGARNEIKKFDQEFRSDEIQSDQIKGSNRSDQRSDRPQIRPISIKSSSKFDRILIAFRSISDRIWIKFGSNVELFGTKSGSTFDQIWGSKCRSRFRQLWWNLKQFWSSGHPKSTRSRSRDPPGESQGAQVVLGDGLERPRHAPGVSRKRPWSVRWAPSGAILMIGVRTNAGTKILIEPWASWTTNDMNFESIFEQIWSIFRS